MRWIHTGDMRADALILPYGDHLQLNWLLHPVMDKPIRKWRWDGFISARSS